MCSQKINANHKLYEIKIQKADSNISHEKRMLYYTSTITNEYFFKGYQTYTSVPELHIFYISKNDIWKLGKICILRLTCHSYHYAICYIGSVAVVVTLWLKHRFCVAVLPCKRGNSSVIYTIINRSRHRNFFMKSIFLYLHLLLCKCMTVAIALWLK